MTILVAWVGVIGCERSSDPAPSRESVKAEQPAATPDGDEGESTIQKKVTIEFPDVGYRFTLAEAAAGVKLNYTIVVADDVPGVIPKSQRTVDGAGPGRTGLLEFEKISGHEQSYSLFDFGYAQPRPAEPITLKKGRYACAVEWNGRNWDGPSDTSHGYGPPFPPGEYQLAVSMVGHVQTPRGERPYEIVRAAPVVLVP
jgi:hypothetical protein